MNRFECAVASVIGRTHKLAGKNNQDAFRLIKSPDITIAVVCDGCGSGAYSEFGSRLGAASLSRHALQILAPALSINSTRARINKLLTDVRARVLDDLSTACQLLGDEPRRLLNDYLLFTSLLAVILPDISFFAGIGDGFLQINELKITLGPYPNNQPPYIGYGLVAGANRERIKASSWSIHKILPTSELQFFALGTDGVNDLAKMQNQSHKLPQNLDDLLSRELIYKNPDGLRRLLTMLNRDELIIDWEKQEFSWHAGRLPDDTTAIIGRKAD